MAFGYTNLLRLSNSYAFRSGYRVEPLGVFRGFAPKVKPALANLRDAFVEVPKQIYKFGFFSPRISKSLNYDSERRFPPRSARCKSVAERFQSPPQNPPVIWGGTTTAPYVPRALCFGKKFEKNY